MSGNSDRQIGMIAVLPGVASNDNSNTEYNVVYGQIIQRAVVSGQFCFDRLHGYATIIEVRSPRLVGVGTLVLKL